MSSEPFGLASGQTTISIPRTAEAITPSWLTEVLRREADFATCTVTSVTPQVAPKWHIAETALLKVEYEEGASSALPAHLFTKINHVVDTYADSFPGEQVFYRDLRTEELPLARCFAALSDDETGATCILLEDLSRTHMASRWPLPPTLDMCRRAVEAIAIVHAHWWGAPSQQLAQREDKLAAHLLDMLPGFFDRLGDRLPTERRALLTTACARIAGLKRARFESGKPVSRIHGDAHFWNVLYPRNPETHACILIDWEDWRIDTVASDLAMMIALHWYPDRRERFEETLLRNYWDMLNGAVETSLTWDDFMLDYRIGHIWNAIVPIYQEQMESSHGSWWGHLERWFMAFDDLGCRELIE